MANRAALGLLGAVAVFVASAVVTPTDARAQGGSGSGSVSFGASGNASTSNGAQGSTDASSSGADTGAAPAGGAAVASSSSKEDWAERDRRLNEGSSLSGGTGLLHMQHAQSGAAGQFRIGFTTEYFS